MNPLVAKKLRFSDVVYALETTPKVVRNWSQRRQVKLSFEDDTPGWRTFSALDVAILILVRKLVDFGMDVETASDFANSILIPTTDRLLQFKNTPPLALPALFNGQNFLVWREAGEWRGRLDYEIQHRQPPADAFVTIAMDSVLRRAIDRAFAGTDDDEPEELVDAARKLTAQIEKGTIETQDRIDAMQSASTEDDDKLAS